LKAGKLRSLLLSQKERRRTINIDCMKERNNREEKAKMGFAREGEAYIPGDTKGGHDVP
jgi:hypothetical protein